MDARVDDIIQQAVDSIVSEIRPEQIILFGAFARGDACPDSDLDFLVIQSEPFTPQMSRRKTFARPCRALMTLPLPADILLYSRNEVENLSRSPGHVVSQALQEGKMLYARA